MPTLNLTYDEYTGGGVSAEQLRRVTAEIKYSFGSQGDYYLYSSNIYDFIFAGGIERTRKIFWKLVKNSAGTAYTQCNFTIYTPGEVNYIRWQRIQQRHSTSTQNSDFYTNKDQAILYGGQTLQLVAQYWDMASVIGGLPIVDEDDVAAFISGDETVAINYRGVPITEPEYYYFYNDIIGGNGSPYGVFTPNTPMTVISNRERFYVANGKKLALTIDPNDSQKILLLQETGIEYEKTEMFNNVTGNWDIYPFRIHYTGPWYDGYNKTKTGDITVATANAGRPNSNIPFWYNKGDADKYIRGDEDTPAPDFDGDITRPSNPTGSDGSDTEMGTSAHLPVATTQYALTKSLLRDFGDWIYTQDDDTWDALKKGVQLFGDDPSQAIMNIMYWPVDVTNFSAYSSEPKMYIGGVEGPAMSGLRKIGYTSKAFTLGETYIQRPARPTYRDFPPYTRAYLYAPYCGEHEIDLARYYGHIMKLKYYIDLWTGKCMCCVFADLTLIDTFEGVMGISQSIRATDFNAFMVGELTAGKDALATVGTAAGTGASIGAAVGTVVPGVGNVAGAIVGGVGGAAAGAYKLMSNKVHDYVRQIGSNNGNLSENLPQSAILIFEHTDVSIPSNLQEIKGLPSNKGGRIQDFSGFLMCSDVKLSCGEATAPEAAEIESLLASGVYI